MTDDFFYRYKGKFWIYRCKDCAHVHNLTYYRDRQAASGKKVREKRPVIRETIATVSSDRARAMIHDGLMKRSKK